MKFADYSDPVTVDTLDAALRSGSFDAVTHYLSGTPGFIIRVEDPAVVAGIRAKGWPQMGIDVPVLRDVNGAAAADRARSLYGWTDGMLLALDIEPGEFDAAPSGWALAADRWCNEVRAAGLTPVVYGVDRTVAACGNQAQYIWRAVPGMCDPAAPGPQGLDPNFKPGQRAVQCSSASFFGINFDVNFSQFDFTPVFTPPLVAQEEEMLLLRNNDSQTIYLMSGALVVPIPGPADAQALLDAGIKQANVSGAFADAVVAAAGKV